MEGNNMIAPELYFQRYACPCASVLLSLKRLDEQTYNKILDMTYNNIAMSKNELEQAFPEAIRRIKKIAASLGKDHWDFEVIKNYFVEGGHNKEIDSGDGFYEKAPETLKDLCRICIAEVIEVKDKFVKVKINDKERVLHNPFIPDIKMGDKVTVHYGFAVEKV
jgi:hydrogenase maturation factor